ncbi:hypothetical protein FSP39_013937 [Pinctada imbricata]|uniref:SOCS box domain-containing protein n=1 Tax=Pinctada imbricata TaxID=66713 RepID=A0AA89BT21_PINIB|nr:hypothetical protein FSP39_013937 [Pinctada imbricata]
MVAYNKRSALHLAAERGNLTCCEALLKAGSHIDAQDTMACTPIFNAATKGQAGVVKFLIERGSDINKRPNNGNSLLHVAASGGSIECCQELLINGFDVNAQNRDGITPLISAVNGKQVKATKYLLDHGSNCNHKGLHGMTALNEAVFYNCPQLVALLLEYGANPDIEDDAGTLPLWFAVDGFSIQSVKLLLLANCRFNLQSTLSSHCGPCNPIEHAIHKKKEFVLDWLVTKYCHEAVNILRQHLPKIQKMTNLEASLVEHVQELAQGPRSLMEHCRKSVRERLGRGIEVSEKIDQLKLPKSIRSYLLFSEMENE